MVLSDPAKTVLKKCAWVDGYDTQNKDKKKTLLLQKMRACYFSVQCIIAKTM